DDGNLDIVLCGNFFNSEVETGKYDASYGLVLTGDGMGKFRALSLEESGFIVQGDAKALARLVQDNKTLFIASQNDDSLKIYGLEHAFGSVVPIPPGIGYCTVNLINGKSRKEEIYIGSGYMSQSSATMVKGKSVKEITFH